MENAWENACENGDCLKSVEIHYILTAYPFNIKYMEANNFEGPANGNTINA
jgi:hypothetical protein